MGGFEKEVGQSLFYLADSRSLKIKMMRILRRIKPKKPKKIDSITSKNMAQSRLCEGMVDIFRYCRPHKKLQGIMVLIPNRASAKIMQPQPKIRRLLTM